MTKHISEGTMKFKIHGEEVHEVRNVLKVVYDALKEKGYNAISQLVGYLLSGDPSYITSHNNARVLIRRLERDEIMEELVKSYLERS